MKVGIRNLVSSLWRVGVVLSVVLGVFVVSPSGVSAARDWPVVVESPPVNTSVNFVRASAGGFGRNCKGFFDASGDYQVNIPVAYGANGKIFGAESLRVYPRTSRARAVLAYKTSTFLGIGTSNGRMCWGRYSGYYAGFENDIVVWVRK